AQCVLMAGEIRERLGGEVAKDSSAEASPLDDAEREIVEEGVRVAELLRSKGWLTKEVERVCGAIRDGHVSDVEALLTAEPSERDRLDIVSDIITRCHLLRDRPHAREALGNGVERMLKLAPVEEHADGDKMHDSDRAILADYAAALAEHPGML